MLTDDELSRELGAAFHTATEDVTYTGRRQPPRSRAAVALPIAAGAVAVAAAGFIATAEPPPTAGTQAAPTDTGVTSPTMISDSVSLAGLTLHYERAAGWPDPVRIDHDVQVPDGARPIPLDAAPGVKAWIGVDPESGDNAAYARSPARNGGATFAVLSSTWSQEQLVDLVRNGRPD